MYGFSSVSPGTILATVLQPSRALTCVVEAIGTFAAEVVAAVTAVVVEVGEETVPPQPAKASTRKAIKDFFNI